MSQKCKYIGIDGTVIKFGYGNGLYLGQGDLRDYAYAVYSPYDKILGFETETKQKQVNLYIKTNQASTSLRNEVFEAFEKDIEYKNSHPFTEKSGRLYIGDYYLNCFVIAAANDSFLARRNLLKKQLTLICENPKWMREIQYSFTSNEAPESGKKYPFKYPYAYGAELAGAVLNNESFTESDFIIVFTPLKEKTISNPYIKIGENIYSFNFMLNSNQRLILNSSSESVVLEDEKGNQSDALYLRNKSNDIFKKIKPGENEISLSANTKVEISLIEERGEPKWT